MVRPNGDTNHDDDDDFHDGDDDVPTPTQTSHSHRSPYAHPDLHTDGTPTPTGPFHLSPPEFDSLLTKLPDPNLTILSQECHFGS